jgi:ubiquinone/menaquinone biosynthesis C-methylase UbiE
MSDWLAFAFVSVGLVLAVTALFFFSVTRGALLLRGAIGGVPEDVAHIYPIYSNRQLIRFVDFQPVSSAILLFQYERLVSSITQGLGRMDLHDKDVLITSCAFGNVIPRVVETAVEGGARQVLIADIIKHELDNAQGKLTAFPGKVEYLEENAVAMRQADGSVVANVIFFLLHELPHRDQVAALREAARVLAPGGKLFLAEFHRPTPWLLRAMGWTYFKTFEPWALAVWDKHDPLRQLEAMGGFTSERHTLLFGYFQIIVATKNAAG